MKITQLMIMVLSATSFAAFAKKKTSSVRINKCDEEGYAIITFDVHWNDKKHRDNLFDGETIGLLWVVYRLQGSFKWNAATLSWRTEALPYATDKSAFPEYAFASPHRAATYGSHSIIIDRHINDLSGAAADHQRISLLWNYRADGVKDDDRVEISISMSEKPYPDTQIAYKKPNKSAEEDDLLWLFNYKASGLTPEHVDLYRGIGIPKNASTTEEGNDNKGKEGDNRKEDRDEEDSEEVEETEDQDEKDSEEVEETEDQDEKDSEEVEETEKQDKEDGEESKKTKEQKDDDEDVEETEDQDEEDGEKEERENQAKEEANYANEQNDNNLDHTLSLLLWMSAIVIGPGGKNAKKETERKTRNETLKQSV